MSRYADPPTRLLATDLDGTLLPLADNVQNRADLGTLAAQLAKRKVGVVFVTGRHYASVCAVRREFDLPTPDAIVCDVGASISQRVGEEYKQVAGYHDQLQRTIGDFSVDNLRGELANDSRLRPQEAAKQTCFKLSYYVDGERLADVVAQVENRLAELNAPYSLVHSVDPLTGAGLLDLLPRGVTKASALAWWTAWRGIDDSHIVYAGDSGNDLAALACGYHAIVVGNADRQLAKQVADAHRSAGWQNRLYLAQQEASSGVLQGCRWFGLAERNDDPPALLGATPVRYDQTHFRVWAPKRQRVAVELYHQNAGASSRRELAREEFGFFCGTIDHCGPGARYRFVLDDHLARPDPASRFQPEGVHGESQVFDPDSFAWTDQQWLGIAKRDLVIYELHVGAFTAAGTFRAAIERLHELVELGITAIEIMPVAQSPGRWNWGYDGVGLFAVRNTYGAPDDFKAFVDACHEQGIAVLLDVVYNHLGPEGNYLGDFGPYFSRKHRTPWGEAFNYDGRHAPRVRRFVIENALRWLDEYHLDGLRLDAAHFMFDDSDPHILGQLRDEVARFAGQKGRTLHLMAETNVYDHRLLATDDTGRAGFDAIWCDCLMHAVYSHGVPDVRLTSRKYAGAPDIAEALQRGFLYTGPVMTRVTDSQGGEERNLGRQSIASLVIALQTHDSVGNHPHGKRLHQLTSLEFQQAAVALTLLYPSIPLLFMGEEYASECVFPFFVDFEDKRLRRIVDAGRAYEHPQHIWKDALSPSDPRAFDAAKCHREADRHPQVFRWYQKLLALRRQGLAEGWLATERLDSYFDPATMVHTLRYQVDDARCVDVYVRLASFAEHAEPATIRFSGELLLDSLADPRNYGLNEVSLQANHAVICRDL